MLRIRLLQFVLCTLAVVAAGSHATPARAADGVPALDHVIVIIMENHSYDEVRTQTYTASLIQNGTSFSDSHGVTHPSQPNYLALWSGSTQGVTGDQCPAPGQPFSGENLGHACEAAGLTWKAYSEDLPSAGSTDCTANSSLYTRKHDPWTDFTNVDHTNEVPFSQLAADEAGGTLPDLAFVIPNNCDNSHNSGCSVAAGDTWLSRNVPAMLDAVGARGMVVLTWDEDDFTASNHILTVFQGVLVKGGANVSTRHVTHYTVLRTICDVLGLQPFGAAALESPLTDIWNDSTGVPTERASWGRIKARYGD